MQVIFKNSKSNKRKNELQEELLEIREDLEKKTCIDTIDKKAKEVKLRNYIVMGSLLLHVLNE